MNFVAKKILGPVVYETTEHYQLSTEELNYFKSRLQAYDSTWGPMASKDNRILEAEPASKIKEFIMNHIKTYVHDVLQINEDVEFYITESWVNCLEPGNQHPIHTHGNSLISGVMFLLPEESEKASPLVFGTDCHEVFRGFEFPYKRMDYPFVLHEKGKLVIFPSSSAHAVPESRDDKERWSLSFNTFFKGNLGISGVNAVDAVGNRLTLT